MTRRVLITRPRDDAVPLAERLTDLGVESIIAPLLSIMFKDGPALSLKGLQALLITSANGVRAFIRRNQERDMPVFTVGEASADAAKAAGFENVISAGGDVVALAALVKSKLNPNAGSLLHVAGTRVAGDLTGDLQAAGFDVRRESLYAADVAETLPAETIQALQNRELDAALIYSPRTAGILVSLIEAAGLQEVCRSMTVFCLSPAVADRAQELPWQDISVAIAPNQDAVLDLILQWTQNAATG